MVTAEMPGDLPLLDVSDWRLTRDPSPVAVLMNDEVVATAPVVGTRRSDQTVTFTNPEAGTNPDGTPVTSMTALASIKRGSSESNRITISIRSA
jgi:hypothetical protein